MTVPHLGDGGPDAATLAAEQSAVELRRIRRFMMMAFLLALFTAVYFARDVLLPIVLAIVLTLTLLPVVRWAERIRVPPAVTAILLMLTLAVTLFTAGYALSGPVSEIVDDAPRMAAQVKDRLDGLFDRMPWLREVTGGMPGEEAPAAVVQATPSESGAGPVAEPDVVAVVSAAPTEPTYTEIAVGGATSAVGSVFAALILTMFLLAAGDFYHRRIVEAAPRLQDKKRALTIIRDVERQISRYLGAITVINLGLGLLSGLALWALGMPMPVLFGIMAFLFNYIPFVGNLVTIALVAVIAFITFDGFWDAVLPPLALVLLSGLESNAVTPLLVGRRLELNNVSQLIMVAFWTWLWGVPGAILAVPFLVVVKAVCDNVDGLQVVSSFLSGDPATREDEPPQKATTGPALGSAPLRTQAEAREDSPPTVAPGDPAITPLPALAPRAAVP